jgi:hypothetical protein
MTLGVVQFRWAKKGKTGHQAGGRKRVVSQVVDGRGQWVADRVERRNSQRDVSKNRRDCAMCVKRRGQLRASEKAVQAELSDNLLTAQLRISFSLFLLPPRVVFEAG